jgi:hypothetical protein
LKTIRDAVHGDISLTDEECALIDTREFQRLRGIKQLGTANLVFPTAVHTRFEHSLGTCFMAQRIVDGVNRRSPTSIAPRLVRLIRVAALLHDITHVPFGHTFEDERRIFARHDEGMRLRLFLSARSSSLSGLLRRMRIRKEVVRLLAGGGGEAQRGGSPPFVSEIVKHTICADLFDYLRRDTCFCGLRQDYDERIFSYFRLVPEGRLTLVLGKNGVLRRDVLSEVMNLLRLRYNLSERVYYHHTKVASGAMLAKAVESAKGITEEFLCGLTDDELVAELESGRRASPVSKRLIRKLRSREVFKRVFMVSAERADAAYRREALTREFHFDPASPQGVVRRRLRMEQQLAERAGLPPGAVILYCPRSDVCLKEAEVRVMLPSGEVTTLDRESSSNPAWGEVSSLNAKYRQLWKFYVFIDREFVARRGRLASACAREFGLENELNSFC